jgi:hypothetical protein
MRLRQKPKKPTRKCNVKNHDYLYDGDILDSYPAGATIERDWDEWMVVWFTDETDEEFAKRQKDYEEKKLRYDRWYAENKKEIEIELNDRIERAKQQKLRQANRLRGEANSRIKQAEKLEKDAGA